MTAAIDRPGVRVAVIDDRDRLLLFRSTHDGRASWVMPGGAIEPGETDEEAATRELREEVGLRDVRLRSLNWTREHVWTWAFTGETYRSSDRFFYARVESGLAVEPQGLVEGEVIDESRW